MYVGGSGCKQYRVEGSRSYTKGGDRVLRNIGARQVETELARKVFRWHVRLRTEREARSVKRARRVSE
jgi:hypothetical protein